VILGVLIVWAVVPPTKGLKIGGSARCVGSRDIDKPFVHEGCLWFNHPNIITNIFHILELFDPIVI